MNKNGKLLNLIFSSESKKKYNNINNQELAKKLSSTKQRISDINFSDIGLKNSNFIGFNFFKTKKEKSDNNSKIKQKKKNLITSINDNNGEKEENINEEIILKYQYYKYLANNNNSKEKNNLKKKYIYGTQIKENNSNIKKNEIINIDTNKSNEFEKKKINNRKLINNKIEKIEKNENPNSNYQKSSRYKKISQNSENKIELFLSSQLKNNAISKEYLLSLFNNNNSIKSKIINNKNILNYTSTNPNTKKEKKYIASFHKDFEKSCPKFNFNKYSSYRQGKAKINIKKLNYENEEIESHNKVEKANNEIKKIKGTITSNHTLVEQNEHIKNKKSLNLEKNKKISKKLSKGKDYNQNIIEFFLPNKMKQNSNNIKEYSSGTLQKVICRNDIKENNSYQKVNTQTNINNKSDMTNLNKIGVKKIRAFPEKSTNNKKDLSLHNMALKKKRQRYFENEINSNIIDTTNILKKFKNKNTYLNLIRKAFNNKNQSNHYYNNYIRNDNNENKSQRDSRSVNLLRNRSNSNINENKKKKKYVNEHYINKLITVNDNKEMKKNVRHYSLNKNDGFYLRKNYIENEITNNKEIIKDKIIENISNNSLNTYSIFISHKCYKDGSKIALRKIKLFDINDNEIPVIFYRTNADFNNGRLFNTTMTNMESNKENNFRDEIMKNNIPFLTEIKRDIYIYFYLNNNNF